MDSSATALAGFFSDPLAKERQKRLGGGSGQDVDSAGTGHTSAGSRDSSSIAKSSLSEMKLNRGNCTRLRLRNSCIPFVICTSRCLKRQGRGLDESGTRERGCRGALDALGALDCYLASSSLSRRPPLWLTSIRFGKLRVSATMFRHMVSMTANLRASMGIWRAVVSLFNRSSARSHRFWTSSQRSTRVRMPLRVPSQ